MYVIVIVCNISVVFLRRGVVESDRRRSVSHAKCKKCNDAMQTTWLSQANGS